MHRDSAATFLRVLQMHKACQTIEIENRILATLILFQSSEEKGLAYLCMSAAD